MKLGIVPQNRQPIFDQLQSLNDKLSLVRGRLPPLIHAVVVIETTVDERGETRDIKVVRGPSHAPDVTEAVKQMTMRINPLPVPARLGGVKYTEIWLVHKDGRFQLDALTEGQN